MSDDVKIALIGMFSSLFTTGVALVSYLWQRRKDLNTMRLERATFEQKLKSEQNSNVQNLLDRAWKMYQDNLDDILVQLKNLKDEREGLVTKVLSLEHALEEERRQRSQVETQLQRVMLALTAYKTGLVLLISQLQEMDVQPRWQPPDDIIFFDGNK